MAVQRSWQWSDGVPKTYGSAEAYCAIAAVVADGMRPQADIYELGLAI